MRITVLGACGAWPEVGRACSGYLVEHAGFRLVMDLGYATLPRLLEHVEPRRVDAVLISHGHPDHCADLNPLLRARALSTPAAPPLPVYALPGALDAVLALDEPHVLADACALHPLTGGDYVELGPFTVRTVRLPHFVANVGFRLSVGGSVVAYTGDTGPSPAVVELAHRADVLLAEATFVDHVPDSEAGFLTSAVQAGRQATAAGARQLVLTHLWPGTDPEAARRAAEDTFPGDVRVARGGLVLDLAS